MVPVMCVVQEGQISPENEAALKVSIGRFVQRAFKTRAEIDWIVVPKGSGFTAAGLSTTIIASLYANRTMGQGERVSLLKELCDICMKTTGHAAREVVTAIRDPR